MQTLLPQDPLQEGKKVWEGFVWTKVTAGYSPYEHIDPRMKEAFGNGEELTISSRDGEMVLCDVQLR